MAKSELKLDDHALLLGNQAVEVWHEGVLVATVYGADGPGVRVISKHPMDIVRGGMGEDIKVIEVRLEVS